MKMSKKENKLRIEFAYGIEETVLNTHLTFIELLLLLLKKGVITEIEHGELMNKVFPKESILETQRKKLKKFREELDK